jgi:hypothetical protein
MIFKIRSPQSGTFEGSTKYEVYNMTTNMKKFPSSSPNDRIEYSLKDIFVDISDSATWWYIPYKIIDTSTPNIIKTKHNQIGSASNTMNYTKEVNALTNTTTYTGDSSVKLEDTTDWLFNNIKIKAILYPNGTGIVESREA